MKKFFLFLMVAVIFFATSCTRQQRARRFGGNIEISIDSGWKLVEATWKDDNLWILIEPMEDDYVPKTKVFKEESSFGIMEGSITFKESRDWVKSKRHFILKCFFLKLEIKNEL